MKRCDAASVPTCAVGGVPEQELMVRAPQDCMQLNLEEATFLMNTRRGMLQKPTSGGKKLDSA